VRARRRYAYRQGATAVPEEVAAHTKLRAHRISAVVDVADTAGAAEGVVLAQGGRFGGFSLYVLGGRPHFTYNFSGLERTTIAADAPLDAGRYHLDVVVVPGDGLAMTARLSVDGAAVGSATIPRTALLRFSLAGEGLCCGYDDGTPVSDAYESPFAFTGVIEEAVIEVIDADEAETAEPVAAPVAEEAEVARALMTE
jgi:arylsulfatase